jgi:class 3 adenylate cyclase
MKILIVDDEPGIRQVCSRALSQAGHEVSSCASGKEALPRLDEHWDLVFSDLAMPGGVDGNEVIRRAREMGQPDVVLMTAYPTVSSSVLALKAGACDYLLKPFALKSLLELVARLAARRSLARRSIENFSRFLSPQVAAQLLGGSCAAFEHRETRAVTILFADIRGFTSFAQGVSPETAAARLDELLACFIEAVHGEGGTINKFTGDGALALFGAPRAHEEPVAAAARAALRARAAVGKIGALRFGYGINHGEAVVGCIGTSERAEFGVIGSAVNIAARLEAAAGPGQILVGPDARALLDARFLCGAPKSLVLEGLTGTVSVSELIDGASEAPSGTLPLKAFCKADTEHSLSRFSFDRRRD